MKNTPRCTKPLLMPTTTPAGAWLLVGIATQQLWLLRGDQVQAHYDISTASNGVGELNGSECTPRGWHRIRARIGDGLPQAAVLRGRRFTGETWTPELHAQHPNRDWILSRILWLCGNEPGLNRGGNVDSQRRYIYFHGTPDSEPMGEPRSHGCIRLRNSDMIELFERTSAGTPVYISETA